MSEIVEQPGNKGGARMPTKENLYARVANHLPDAIDKAVKLLDSNNESIQLGAIKVLLDRGLPAQKAIEITGPNGGPLQLKYIIDLAGGYIPPLGAINAAPNTGDARPAPLQSAGMAQESPQDNHSTDGTGQTGSV